MSGTLTQLAARGAQDTNLTVTPEVTFFKGVWKQHTNFATEAIEQEFVEGVVKSGNTVVTDIPRSGDLVTDIWVKLEIAPLVQPDNFPFVHSESSAYSVHYVDELGHALIKNVKVQIGGQTFDTHTSEFLHAYHQLCSNTFNAHGRRTTNNENPPKVSAEQPVDEMLKLQGIYSDANTGMHVNAASETQHLYVPLRFWFCEHRAQALPLVALMYHDVKISIEFRKAHEVITSSTTTKGRATAVNAGDDSLYYNQIVNFERDDTHPYWPEMYDVDISHATSQNVYAKADQVWQTGMQLIPKYLDLTQIDTATAVDFANSAHANSHGNAYYKYGSHTQDVILSAKLLINYVFLDTVERKMFATMEHNYLIDTVQTDTPSHQHDAHTNNLNLMFNHPVKELIWMVRPQDNVSDIVTLAPAGDVDDYWGGRGQQRWGQMYGNAKYNKRTDSFTTTSHSMEKNYFNFAGPDPINGEMHAFDQASLRLNGHLRFEDLGAPFLRTVLPSKCHSCIPRSFIYSYNFAVDPEDWKPTGSLNFSRLDTVRLELSHSKRQGLTSKKGNRPQCDFICFARSINILKVGSGMASLKYSN